MSKKTLNLTNCFYLNYGLPFSIELNEDQTIPTRRKPIRRLRGDALPYPGAQGHSTQLLSTARSRYSIVLRVSVNVNDSSAPLVASASRSSSLRPSITYVNQCGAAHRTAVTRPRDPRSADASSNDSSTGSSP